MIRPSRPLQFTALGLGFLFLYIPIISLIVYSFNESQLVTVWTQFSLRWYKALWYDDELINAAWLSLKIAVLTACASVAMASPGRACRRSRARQNGRIGIRRPR